ncbi:hypothetical protein [Sulfurimonas sp. NW7]
MAQHFLLSAKSRTILEAEIVRMIEDVKMVHGTILYYRSNTK